MQPRSLLATSLGLLSAFVVGGFVAVQTHINGRLAVELGAGLTGAAVAALVSFGTGLLVLCVVCAAARPARRGLRRIGEARGRRRLRTWHLLGGSAGALLVAAQGLTVATIGVALFTVAVVAGQTGSALLVDRAGAGPAGHRPVTAGRTVGAGLAVVAVVLAVSERLDGAAALAPAALLLAALPLFAGGCAAWQQAANGQVSVVAGPFPAAWLNFAVGTALLAAVAAAAVVLTGWPDPLPATWWLYSGGPLGVVFISAAAVLVRALGVLVFGLAAISGQVVTALAVDLLASHVAVGPLTVAGTVLTLVGVAVASVPRWVKRNTAENRRGTRDRDRRPSYSD